MVPVVQAGISNNRILRIAQTLNFLRQAGFCAFFHSFLAGLLPAVNCDCPGKTQSFPPERELPILEMAFITGLRQGPRCSSHGRIRAGEQVLQ